jgi:predicted Zn-dependent protease
LYAATLAAIKLRDLNRANDYINRLKTAVAGDLYASYATKLIAIEGHLAANKPAAALAEMGEPEAGKRLSRAELFAYSQVQIANAQAPRAAQNLRTWVVQNPTDAPAWQLLGAAYKAADQPLRAIRAEAEAQVALLDYTAALDRFKAAQEWVRANSSTGASTQASRDFMEESIVDVRTRQVQELLRQQIKDEKEAK